MPALPSHANILQECLEVCALAQARYVSPDNFNTLPYLKHVLESQADVRLVESLLALAVKARFLDDRESILRAGDRRLRAIGRYYENGTAKDSAVCIREALNKLVHHQSLQISTDTVSCWVVGAEGSAGERRLLQEGAHHTQRVIVTVEGERNGTPWRFEISLFTLLNELARVLEPLG